MRLMTEKAFRRAVEAAKQTDRPASEVLMLYSENEDFLRAIEAGYQNVSVKKVIPGSKLLRGTRRALLAAAAWLRENREEARA